VYRTSKAQSFIFIFFTIIVSFWVLLVYIDVSSKK